MKTLLTLLTLLATWLCQANAAEDILTTLSKDGHFNKFLTALHAADKDNLLKSGTGPYTVFAPNDAAFDKLPKGTLDGWLQPENKDKLGRLMDYHVVPIKLPTSELHTSHLPTSNAAELNVTVQGPVIRVNNARVLDHDVEASNGVIHVVDSVIVPK